MARVLLINPPSPEPLGAPLVGLQYVAAALLGHGSDVRIIDAAAQCCALDTEAILEQACDFDPQIVGLGLFTTSVRYAYPLVERLRGRFPILVAGGPHATACPREVLDRGFDAAVLGEAERALVALVDRVDRKTPLEGIAGIECAGRAGRTCGSEPDHVSRLDSLPFPLRARHLFESQWYGYAAWPAVSHGIVSSRGCPARCTFCANSVTGSRMRFRSPENVVAEMEESRASTGETFFPFWDDAFTADTARVMKLCAAMENRLSFLPGWSATTRVTMVQPALLAAMKQAGLCHLNFGVESGDDAVLHAIGKKIRTDQVVRALELSKEAGVPTSCNFMFGFPEDTAATLERTLRFMERIAPLVDFFSPFGVLIPMPATPLYERNHERYGFTEWWVREEFGGWRARPRCTDFDQFCRVAADDPVLDVDFFHYPEDVRGMIRACLEFKAAHNVRRMRTVAANPGVPNDVS